MKTRLERFQDARDKWPAFVRVGQYVEIDQPFDLVRVGRIVSLNARVVNHVLVQTNDGRRSVNVSWLKPR